MNVNKGYSKLLIACGLTFGLNTFLNAASPVKPNVIIILSDDQGSIDLNCFGSKDLHTPNMDKLAKTGVRFTRFYSGSAICSPSRAGLLTGKSPQSAGLEGNAPSENGDSGMPSNQVTIAEIMKEDGYATAHIGKWHLGYSLETMPLAQGFNYSFGHMGGCIDNYSHFFYWGGSNRHDLWENGVEVYKDGEYFPDIMVNKAESFIKDHNKDPFFLYLAFNSPHYPLQPTKKWRDYYKNLPSPRREYAGFISSLDERIGKIINLLEAVKLRENTIIIFLSDQGHSYEDRTGGGGGSAGPYRGGKFSLFEGGIRVPAIISWKGQIPEDVVCDKLCLSMDILPTIANLCGINHLPEGIEGKSIKPVIFEEIDVHAKDTIVWQLDKQWAVRIGDWKLIGNPVDPSVESKNLHFPKDNLFLTNSKTDISESKNIASLFPEKLNEMISSYKKWKHANEKNRLSLQF